MGDQPIEPMPAMRLARLRLDVAEALHKNSGAWWRAGSVAALLARLDAEIARANAAEAERDAALARALPAPVKMETVEQVEALAPTEAGYLILRPTADSRFKHWRCHPQHKGFARWWLRECGMCSDSWLVGAWIIPLPDLPIPTTSEED